MVLKISDRTMPMVVRIAIDAAAISSTRIARSTVLRARKSLVMRRMATPNPTSATIRTTAVIARLPVLLSAR